MLEHQVVINYLKSLRELIIDGFQSLEPVKTFEKTKWSAELGGGGEIGLLRGDVFEKAAVNFSAVSQKNFPTKEAKGPFFATGVSVITHMQNPHAPTVHFNVRYIETKDRFWFGGGYDLTPMGFPYKEDAKHFHGVAKKTLNPFGSDLYREFSQNAKDYFFIPHRKRERGVGGIFFDHYNTGNSQNDYQMWQAVGNTFLETIMPIYKKRCLLSYSKEDKKKQALFRGAYVEFNLLYDRGTKFGFLSRGNPEAILASLPPCANW